MTRPSHAAAVGMPVRALSHLRWVAFCFAVNIGPWYGKTARTLHYRRMALSPIPEILDELRAGRIIVLVDDENRENEGDFVCAAEKVSNEVINFMTRVGGGYLCLALTGADCDRLALVPQASANTSPHMTAMTVSVDEKEVMRVTDRGIGDPFDGFAMVNRGGDYVLRRIAIRGTR